MEDMDDLYTKIQAFLMKKDKECDQLRFLTSRTTTENSEHVQNICDSLGAILKASDIPVNESSSKTDERCVQAFKYLALNTFFECQEYLAEDLANGHLVDMCPPLSAYLFIEILWSLGYEAIVAESMLHIPLDLCVEILTIARRCVGLLDFPRGLEFVAALTLNCYKKMILVARDGIQSINLDEGLELLTIHWQELIALFTDPRFLRLDEVAGLKKSERLGLILKRIIALTIECLKCSRVGVELPKEIHSIYRITFGRLETRKSSDDCANHLRMLDQEFAHLLLRKLKEVDCNTYLDWASLEDRGRSAISMQQSVGNDCYNLMEFIKGSEHLIQNDHLVECLQQLASKPKTEPILADLDLEELRREAANGKKESLKELMNRYREWDHETFGVVDGNRNLLDKDDILNLLEYLTLLMTKPGQEDHKRRVYATVTRILMQQEIPDVYETILQYILKHDARNTLESAGTEDSFVNFMAHNRNFRSSQNLRVVLLFLLKNPRKILSILLRMTIGDPEFENVMISPGDLNLLSPVMSIRDGPDEILVLSSLRGVCLESREWTAKKFAHLVQVMLDNCVFTADKLVNNVFVPCLNEKTIGLSKIGSILNCLRKIAASCTVKTDCLTLLETLAKRMKMLRKDVKVPKYSSNEILSLVVRVVEIFIRKSAKNLDTQESRSRIERIEFSLEPIDRHHFAGLLSTNLFPNLDVLDAITDYERRCSLVMSRVEAKREIEDDRESNGIEDYSRFRDDFLRYIIVKSTEREYVKFATEATIIHWRNFGCGDEYEAYEKVVRLTIEGCVFCLEFPGLNPPNSFACLLRGLARYTRGIASLEEVRDIDKLYESLADNFRALDKSARNSVFAELCTPVVLAVNNKASHEPVAESLRELVRSIDDFGNKCMEIAHEVQFDRAHSAAAARFRIVHEFVDECIAVDDDGSYESISRIYRLLCSRDAD